jgi:hypothetical protein
VAELSEYLGHHTNNYAEYQGLLAALRYAAENQIKALKVISDSELMVRQMKGIYKVRHPDCASCMTRRRNWCGGWSTLKFGTRCASTTRLRIGWRMRPWIGAGKGQVSGFRRAPFVPAELGTLPLSLVYSAAE